MADFDFEDEPAPRPRRRREAGHGDSAFKTMFGGAMGCFVALGLVLVLMCGGCMGLAFLGREAAPPAEKVSPAEPKRK